MITAFRPESRNGANGHRCFTLTGEGWISFWLSEGDILEVEGGFEMLAAAEPEDVKILPANGSEFVLVAPQTEEKIGERARQQLTEHAELERQLGTK